MPGNFVSFFDVTNIVYFNTGTLGVAPAGTRQFYLKWTVQLPSNDFGTWFFANTDFPPTSLSLNITKTSINIGQDGTFDRAWLTNNVGTGNATTIEISYDDTVGPIASVLCFQDGTQLPLFNQNTSIPGPIVFPSSTYLLGYEIGSFPLCAADFSLYVDTTTPVGTPVIALSTNTSPEAYGLNPNGTSGPWTPNGTVRLCGVNPVQPLYSIGIGCWPCHATAQGIR